MSKIDWKFVSQTEGYQSLKAAVNRDKMRWPGSEADRMEGFFRDAIKICHRLSLQTGIPIDIILSWCEHHRDYWYANFYKHEARKLVGTKEPWKQNRVYPSTVRGHLKLLKKERLRYSRYRTLMPDDHRRNRIRRLDLIKRLSKNP